MSVGAARLSREALEQAARAGLAQRAVQAFTADPLDVRAGPNRIWDIVSIGPRGRAWEIFDARRTGHTLTPQTFPVFDQIDDSFTIATSNKTLDLVTLGYSREDARAVYNRLATYIDQVATFRRARRGDVVILGLSERRLHVLMPAGESLPGQALQIAAAEQYAIQRGVVLQIEYAR